jgi:hypothetical protein
MANGEWLTQLLSGLGGAFTGEVAARSRIAEEQEAQRKRDEAERLKEQERSLSELRRGLLQSFSPENARAAAAKGLPTAEVAAIMRMNEPTKTEPKITERRENGGIAIYEDGNFKSWKIRPPAEREGPSALQLANVARGDVRAARSELRGAEALYGSTMARAPKQSQFLTPLDEPDTLQYRLARESWRPESIYAAQRRAGAQQDVEEAEQEFRRVTGQAAPAGAPVVGAGAPVRASAAFQQQIANDLRDKIAEIVRDPSMSPAQKQAMIQRASEQAAAFLRQ